MTFHPTDNPVFWKKTAEELLAAKRFEKAAAAFQQLCSLTPNDADAWYGLGQALVGLERYGDAAQSFERSLVLRPDTPDVLEGLAACCEALGEVEKMAACRIRLGCLPKNCIACGMPMKDAADFAMGDESKDYCIHCARPDGTMQSFDEKKESMITFIIRMQGLSHEAAESAALSMMKKFPAWKSHFTP